jgi:hypothetical protein
MNCVTRAPRNCRASSNTALSISRSSGAIVELSLHLVGDTVQVRVECFGCELLDAGHRLFPPLGGDGCQPLCPWRRGCRHISMVVHPNFTWRVTRPARARRAIPSAAEHFREHRAVSRSRLFIAQPACVGELGLNTPAVVAAHGAHDQTLVFETPDDA